jgi:predicted Zn-dependent protease
VPGGAIYIHTGLILAANDVSELAGVMAHEMGHVTARHTAQQYRRARNTNVLAQIVAFVGAIWTGQPQATGLLAQLGASAYLNTFSQDAERQSDQLGIETLVKAGYDPYGMVRMFETLQTHASGPRVPQFLSTHPSTPERMANARKEIEDLRKSGIPIGSQRDDGGRLEIIQKRIRMIEGMDTEIDRTASRGSAQGITRGIPMENSFRRPKPHAMEIQAPRRVDLSLESAALPAAFAPYFSELLHRSAPHMTLRGTCDACHFRVPVPRPALSVQAP